MVRMNPERVLLIGDSQRQIEAALAQAVPTAQITTVGYDFDGIAELTANPYTAVLAAAEPIERRPDVAVKTLRELAPDARLVLFGHPTLDPLTRKMLEFGCDDYVITPANPGELHQIFGAPRLEASPAATVAAVEEPAVCVPGSLLSVEGLPLAEIVLKALSDNPGAALAGAIKELNEHLASAMQLVYLTPGEAAPAAPDGRTVVSHGVRGENEEQGQLHLVLPRDEDANTARHFLSRLADLLGQLRLLQERHNRLQKLAITDELTGLYNARYFRHFLSRILERSRDKLFPVTLFIFDIDNFKKYNDRFGHGVGDEILKQTAALIRRCCREHDLVARLGGDEFAVVFWEKEGPRQIKEHREASDVPVGTALRPPQTPEMVLERFRRLLKKQEYPGLGPSGQGTLTISGGVAVFPYHAHTMEELIQLADRRLMFGAKQSGKNSIFLIGGTEQSPLPGPGKV
jgi:GGDEF domain-containing protein